MLAQQRRSGEGFLRRDVAARGHDEIWLLAVVVGCEWPDAYALCAVHYCVVHVQELQVVLLVDHDDVDVVLGAEAVVEGGDTAVAVRWEIESRYLSSQYDFFR